VTVFIIIILRYVEGFVLKDSMFGQGNGSVVASSVPCNAKGSDFNNCFHSWQFSSICDRHNDAGIVCTGVYLHVDRTYK